MFGRALRLRCPNCRQGKRFVSWLRIAPFVLFPFSKTLFLAFDLIFRPPHS